MDRQERLEQLFQTLDTITRWKAGRQRREPMPVGLPTQTRLAILLAIAHDEVETIKDLAERFRMTSSAATQLVNSLSEDGLVTRKDDVSDRRKTRLEVTPAGKKTLLLAKKRCMKILSDLFAPLNERELQTMQAIQEKIVQHLQPVWNEGPHESRE